MDPDDILTNEGSNALEALISKARPLSDVLWSIEQQREPVTTPEQKAALEQRLEKLVASITHVAVQNHYRMFFREKIWKFTRNKTKRSAEPTRQHAIHITDVHLEEDILAVLLTFPALLQDESLYESLYAVEFSSKILDKIRLIALEEGVSEEGLASGLVALLKREGLQSEVARLKLVKDNALSGIINSVFAITLQDAKRRIERNIAELHLLHLKEEQQEIRQQYTEESETRAMAFQEEIERWLLHIQQLELQESDEMNM